MGTLNLCLKIPEKMQKTRNESDHAEKLSKNHLELTKIKIGHFSQFLDVFSAQDGPINF